MAIANTREMTRRPTHPGEMLREDFLPDYGLSVAALAEAAGVSRQSMNFSVAVEQSARKWRFACRDCLATHPSSG